MSADFFLLRFSFGENVTWNSAESSEINLWFSKQPIWCSICEEMTLMDVGIYEVAKWKNSIRCCSLFQSQIDGPISLSIHNKGIRTTNVYVGEIATVKEKNGILTEANGRTRKKTDKFTNCCLFLGLHITRYTFTLE